MKNRKMTGLIIPAFIIYSLFLSHAFAQEKAEVAVLAKSKSDGVWLRWAPTSASSWQLGNKYGYTIERFALKPNGDMEEGSKLMLTTAPLKPLTSVEFDKITSSSDEAAVLQELLYSKDYQTKVSANDLSSVWSRNNEIENRFGIALLMCDLSLEAAKAGALFYNDAAIEKGKRYVYRIQIASPAQVGKASGVLMVNTADIKPLMEIKDLKVDFGNKKATLSWSTLFHKSIYSAYYIERSSDGKNFTKLSDLPYVHMSEKLETETAFYVDSLVNNQTNYYYRINGVSPFAEKGSYSNVVNGQGKEDLTGLLVIREGKVLDQRKVKIGWEFPTSIENQITGFFVSNANNPAGPYTDLHKKPLEKSVREYTQETTFNNTYYVLRGVDKNGKEVARSFPYLVQIADEAPPSTPAGLTGSIDKSGIASLSWTANTEKDLLGYRVFRTNTSGEELVEITKEIITKPQFFDSVNIKVLNKKIYFSVIAVDKNFNTSGYSPLLKLNRPDEIPPTAPVLTRTDIVKDTIVLSWINSTSDDVARYELTRIEKDARISRPVLTWYPSAPIASYKDRGAIPGNTYQYKISATDSAGNTSQTLTREFLFEPGFRKAVSDVKSTVDRENKKISITWKNPLPAVKCIIYRKINDKSFTIYQTIEGNIEAFTDKQIDMNNIYFYKIQPVYAKGVRSIISEEIMLTY